jgi:hypothetical protein
MQVCLVSESAFYTDMRCPLHVHRTKKGAEEECRKLGFKYNREEGLFLNHNTGMLRELTLLEVKGEL